MKKIRIFCLCALLSVSVLGCTNNDKEEKDTEVQIEENEIEEAEIDEITVDDPFAEE